MKKHFTVMLNDISRVNKLVTTAHASSCTITAKSGRYVVDAKSILGILSLDITKPIEIECEGDEDAIDLFTDDIGEFVTYQF